MRPHAQGGLGEVHVARDDELNREVALKRLRGPYADDGEARRRFVLEAEITGGLEHPGIVPVYGLGQGADGRPVYAMRFIRGESLKKAIADFHDPARAFPSPRERELARRRLLERFIAVCNAVAYAHSRGVVHRDLKPANVMLGPYGETLVVDWGLARTVQAGGTAEAPLRPELPGTGEATVAGAVVGTPAYMAPEQAAGRGDVGPAADVYSLGATLYCLLTGKPPFEKGELREVLARVRAGDFPPPSRVNREAPAPLAAVCRKAMGLRPEDRYTTPLELAADLERWLADEPVAVYREPLLTRLARWSRRHLVALTILGGLALLAVLVLPFLLLLLRPGGAGGRPLAQVAEARQRRKSADNLKQVAGAVHTYHDAYNQLPPPKDKRPRPTAFHILPYIEQDKRFNTMFKVPNAGKQVVSVYRNPDRAARDPETVVRVMTEIIKQHPNRSEALVERARAFLALGQVEQAREDLERAAEHNQRRSDAYLERAEKRLKEGKHKEALYDANAGVLLQVASPLAYQRRAAIHEARGDKAAAGRDRDRAAALAGKKP